MEYILQIIKEKNIPTIVETQPLSQEVVPLQLELRN